MDETDAKYVVGWLISGETEISANTPEHAITKAKRQLRSLLGKQGDVKVSLIKDTFSMPSQ